MFCTDRSAESQSSVVPQSARIQLKKPKTNTTHRNNEKQICNFEWQYNKLVDAWNDSQLRNIWVKYIHKDKKSYNNGMVVKTQRENVTSLLLSDE